MVNRVLKRERLMNLVAALLAAGVPVPFREITGRVVGYDDPAGGEALEKRFDRDKAELRRLGIPVEYRSGEDGGACGYVIPVERVFQQRVSFTPQEAMLLSIAGRVGASATGGGPLEEALKSALRKLAVDLQEMDPLREVGEVTVLRSRSGDPRALENVSILSQAVTGGRAARFTYRSAHSGECAAREVQPYGLGLARGAWYLVGRCTLREALRVFKVARILGRVELVPPADRLCAYEVPADFRLEHHLELAAWELGEGQPFPVTLRAGPGFPVSAYPGSARRIGEDGRGVLLELEVRRPQALVEWVLARGGTVVVERPPELRQAVRAEAERLLARYAGAATARDDHALAGRRAAAALPGEEGA